MKFIYNLNYIECRSWHLTPAVGLPANMKCIKTINLHSNIDQILERRAVSLQQLSYLWYTCWSGLV